MMRLLVLIFTLTPFMVLAEPAWQGRVVGVADGDTLTVLSPEKIPVKIRIMEIDAPEKKQPFFMQSKKSLSDLCFGEEIYVKPNGRDKYKRTLARVVCKNRDASMEQADSGMAWAYTKYLTDQRIAEAEDKSRKFGRGLWADDSPIPPWEWRKGRRK